MRNKYGDFLWWSVKRALERHTRRFRPDVILGYWAHPDGEVAVRTGQCLGAPAAVITGGSDVLVLPRSPRRRACIERVFRRSDAVLTVSDGVRQAVLDLGIDPASVYTVQQGIDPEVFFPGRQATACDRLIADGQRIGADRPLLLWVGRMVPIKRIDVLIKAFAQVIETVEKAQLCLIGDGPQQSIIRRLTLSMGLKDRVRFIGPVEPGELADWYRAADLTVLTSDSEGIPNVLRESMACGTPFVSTDVGSVRELNTGGAAAFAPAGDPAAIAAVIVKSLTRAAPAGSVPAPRTWDDRASDITEILDRCIAKRLPPVIRRSPAEMIS